MDNAILFDANKTTLKATINKIKAAFEIDVQGSVDNYLGVKVARLPNGSWYFTQPQLINSILVNLGLINTDGTPCSRASSCSTPCNTSKVLGPNKNGHHFDYNWNHQLVVGKLNYLEKSTRPKIAYVVHQCARFASLPTKVHGKAIKHIGRYLLGTRNKGMVFNTNQNKSLECFVDANFDGAWDHVTAANNP